MTIRVRVADASLLRLGRLLFAVALIGLGVDHFVFERFVTGRAPAWPASLPGGTAWAYLTGLVVVAAGVAIVAGRWARPAAMVTATLVLLWALLRHLPVVAASSFPSSDWTNASKALRFIGGGLAVAAASPRVEPARRALLHRVMNLERELILPSRWCVGVTLILNGTQHFVFTDFVASLIPASFPGNAEWWTYFGGVALLAGGAGLLVPRTARWAALLSGMTIFSWFFIVHVSREFAGVADGIAVYEALLTAGSLFVIAGSASAAPGDGAPG